MTTRFRTRGQREADQFNSSLRAQRVFQTEATDKQLAFIDRLLNDLAVKIADSVDDEVNRKAFMAHQTIKTVVELNAEANTKMTKFDASQAISLLLEASNGKFTPRTPVVTTPVVTQEVVVAEPAPIGVYQKDGDYYRVAETRNTNRRLAYRWNGRRWDYARGMVYRLTTSDLVSVEEVRAFGLRTGMCAICGRTLTDPASVQKGIGPICEGKYGRFLQTVTR